MLNYYFAGGSNENPSIYEILHHMTSARAAHTQGWIPANGNVRADLNLLDPVPVPRR